MTVLEIAQKIVRDQPAPQAVDPLRLARRRGEGAPRLGVVHRSPDRAARFHRGPAQHGHGGPGRRLGSDRTDQGGQPLHGGPNYLQLVGSRRLSTELGDLVEKVNTEDKHGFVFDYAMDAERPPDEHLLPQRPLRVRPLRHPDRLLHHRWALGLPPGDRRAGVHRLRRTWRGWRTWSTTSRCTWPTSITGSWWIIPNPIPRAGADNKAETKGKRTERKAGLCSYLFLSVLFSQSCVFPVLFCLSPQPPPPTSAFAFEPTRTPSGILSSLRV